MIPYAPGSRTIIRDEEWLIRRVDPSKDGGWLLTCDGISELVRGTTALFLSKLEDEIRILNPAETQLEVDDSKNYSATILYLESLRRRNVPNDDKVHLGHKGVMNLMPYQLDPAIQALKQPRTRILIADAVGLGKTLEAGILATELIQRGRGKRILVVTQKAMLTQFQKEFWSRFSIPLTRLDSVGLNRVRNRIPANHNPFNYFDRSIISVDTLKSNLEYRNYLENAWWDIIIIDECHNVAARAGESGLAKRAKLAKLLATRSDSLILLSATPHDGSARSFASLMALLDPTAISDPDSYTPDDFKSKGLVIRRFKKDIKDQVSADFKERDTFKLQELASALEEAAYRSLLSIHFTQGGKHQPGKNSELQRIGMQKALFSSPAAARKSVQNRIAVLQRKASVGDDEIREIAELTDFEATLAPLLEPENIKHYSKYQRLLRHLKRSESPWTPSKADDRLVVFSERIETLHWLRENLAKDIGLKANQLEVLHGQMSDTEQQDIVDRFGRLEDPIRLLLCSDVASEGLNLHYFCHRLVHFDLPWSLMIFQQRNGRVDRYGQKNKPEIVYLFTESSNEKIKGDTRILEILQRKDDQANENLGDPSAFLNVYDPEKEAEKIAEFMASGASASEVESAMDGNAQKAEEGEGDWLLDMFSDNVVATSGPDSSLGYIDEVQSLFETDFQYAVTALEQLNAVQKTCHWENFASEQTLTLTAPSDLQDRLKQLPREVQSSNDHYTLCANAAKVVEAIEAARQAKAEEQSWPSVHYLWTQHPIIEWLGDRVLTQIGRHKAPVIKSPFIDSGEQAFVLMSSIPNMKGQPMLVDWQVAIRLGNGPFRLEPFASFVERAKLKAGKLPNSNQVISPQAEAERMQTALPDAVRLMERHMIEAQKVFATELNQSLQNTLQELERLQNKQLQQLELDLEKQLETVRKGRFQQRSQQINKVFDEYRKWVDDTLNTEPQPWIQVLAAVCNPAQGA